VEKHGQFGPSVRFEPFKVQVRSGELRSQSQKTLLHEQLFNKRYFPSTIKDFPKGGGKC
jgi:hypothetical protein